MPFPAILLIIATLCPLAGCIALLPLGRKLGTPLAGYIATFFIVVSFLCTGWGMLRWISGGNYHGQPFGKLSAPISVTWKCLPIGTPAAPSGFEQDHPGWLDVGIYIDSLTLSLFLTVTLAAMLVHIFATRSLRRDPRYPRFFATLSLACFAALAVFLSATLLQAIVCLELLGFAVSMLLAFRSENAVTAKAAGKLFSICRVGDLGLFIGSGILIHYVGNLSFPDLWLLLSGGAGYHPVFLSGGATVPAGALTAAGVALFFGAAVRCAQFPLHVWAGDAAEGIAPVAAIIFSIALSAAGLCLIARLFPLFTPSARLFIAIVGTTSLVTCTLIATVQADVKKALAWLSAGQLGYMMLGIGVGSWAGAMFHLVAYIFFQTLLFLAAGAVIRAARGETQLTQYGGLLLRMPVTAIASLVGVLAVCGVGWGSVGFSGYFSRGTILQHAGAFASLAAGAHRSGAYWLLFAIPIATTAIVSFAIVRWWVLTFAGVPRDRRLFDHAREASTLYWPIVILAIMSMLVGNWLGVRDMLESSVVEARQVVTQQVLASPAYAAAPAHTFEAVWNSDEQSDEEGRIEETTAGAAPSVTVAAQSHGRELATRWGWVCWLAGLLAALLLYLPGNRGAGRLARVVPASWIHTWLWREMYFNEVYTALFVTIPLSLASAVAWFDRNVVDRVVDLASFAWLF